MARKSKDKQLGASDGLAPAVSKEASADQTAQVVVEKPSLDEAIGKAASSAERSSSSNSDFAKHPKFAKFIQTGDQIP